MPYVSDAFMQSFTSKDFIESPLKERLMHSTGTLSVRNSRLQKSFGAVSSLLDFGDPPPIAPTTAWETFRRLWTRWDTVVDTSSSDGYSGTGLLSGAGRTPQASGFPASVTASGSSWVSSGTTYPYNQAPIVGHDPALLFDPTYSVGGYPTDSAVSYYENAGGADIAEDFQRSLYDITDLETMANSAISDFLAISMPLDWTTDTTLLKYHDFWDSSSALDTSDCSTFDPSDWDGTAYTSTGFDIGDSIFLDDAVAGVSGWGLGIDISFGELRAIRSLVKYDGFDSLYYWIGRYRSNASGGVTGDIHHQVNVLSEGVFAGPTIIEIPFTTGRPWPLTRAGDGAVAIDVYFLYPGGIPDSGNMTPGVHLIP